MRKLCASLLLLFAVSCQGGDVPKNTIPSAASHASHFPIDAGTKHALGSDTPAISCDSCHGQYDTFKSFDCLSCHAHADAAALAVTHRGLDYVYSSEKCYTCHADGSVSGSMPVGLVADPARAVAVTERVPTFAGTVITNLAAQTATLPMAMNHAAKAVDSKAFAGCAGCHPGLNSNPPSYTGGVLHASLTALAVAQPATCTECHLATGTPNDPVTIPKGFVGPLATAPARTPPSGEMRHDAHVWAGNAPGTTLAAPQECGLCHLAPTATVQTHWSTGLSGTGLPLFHGQGAAAPASCLDCHANSRPGVVSTPGASGGGTIQFDHGATSALGECTTCHAAAVSGGYKKWAGGLYHLPGQATPGTCMPCHAGERPTSTAGWTGSWQAAPFDYVTNAQGVTHGGGQDCVACHASQGTGTWTGGKFNHATSAVAKTTCFACHTTQRADLNAGALTAQQTARLGGFDHAVNGNGDCFGCHQTTVTTAAFASYATDWQGGKAYPGSTPVGSPANGVTVVEILLARSSATGLVTSMTAASASYFTNMVHTSSAIPSQLSPGPDTAPNNASCWHCHTHALNSTTVTSYANGDFHGSLTGYSPTPGGAVTALAEPTHCLECHLPMLPQNIVGAPTMTTDLQPMDHAAQFASAVVLGGVSVTSVSQMECALCHKPPSQALGLKFTDGVFHANIGAAQPKDCTACHYPLMADAAKADLAGATKAKMVHLSAQVGLQDCAKCHTGALAKAGSGAPAAALWQGGALHASVSAQPASCNECHSGALPSGATASGVSYTFASGGGTATNGTQWMSHTSADVAGRDCSACHLADAKSSGAAWSKLDTFHKAVPSPAACQGCHGLTNGNGSVAGTKNNLPLGASASPTKTSAGSTNGVPATTLAQITHADINVSPKDCNLCHSAPAAATPAGKEWAQGSFHSHFAAGALVMNGTTGRCSSCHLAEKPVSGTNAATHTGLTAASGSTDCAQCHKYPGTGTTVAGNWLGATGGAPTNMSLGGYKMLPSAAGGANEPAVTTAPHSTNTTCTACHTGGTGAKSAIGYDHSSTVASCNTCHEAGSNDLSPVWNGATATGSGLGDTRPYTLTATTPSWRSCTWRGGDHFYGADCSVCHTAPSGVATGATTSATTLSKWRSKGHPPKSGSKSSGWCAQCHNNGCN